MKRVLSLVISLVLLMSVSYCVADGLGEKFRFESHFVELLEPEWNHSFIEIDGYLLKLSELLGYYPKDFDINESDFCVTIYLYQDALVLPCLIAQNGRTLVPDVWPDDDVIEANELYSKFQDEEYNLYSLQNDDYKILEAEGMHENRPLRITVESEIEGEEGKTFEVSAFSWDIQAGEFIFDQETYRQLWYEIHGRF